MATRTLKATGGNWNSTGTWNEGAVPIAGDTVTCSGGGNLTVTATAACASIDFTGFSNTFTINNTVTLTLTSTFKLVSGMIVSGTGGVILNGTLTLTSGGNQPAWNFAFQGANTYTLGDNWATSGAVTLGSGANNINFTSNQFTVNGTTFTCGTSGTISGTTKFVLAGSSLSWTASAAGTLTNSVDITGTVAIGSANVRYGTGTLTGVSGVFSSGSNALNINAATATIGLGTITVGQSFNITFLVASTITLGAALTASTITFANGNCGFTGTFDVTCNTLTNTAGNGRTYTFPAGQTLTINTSFTLQSNSATGHHILNSTSGGTQVKVKVIGGATMALIYLNLTDIDATLGNMLLTYGGTLSNCLNCASTYMTADCMPSPSMLSYAGLH